LSHHCLEQLFLARKIEVKRAARDAGARRDIVEPRCGKAALGETLERRSDDLGRPLLLAAAPARSIVVSNY
jgi:hypothetical protein